MFMTRVVHVISFDFAITLIAIVIEVILYVVCSCFFSCYILLSIGFQFSFILVFVVVISALDELKKYESGARDATKFLEQEFKKGNR